jgi:subtilisin-like proprotein convertase family protein
MMKTLKAILVLMLLTGLTPSRLHAQTSESYSFTPNRTIPDGNPAGISEVKNLNSAIGSISSLTVRLKITGEFNGDLYGYIRHGGRLAVVLNRPGKMAQHPHGYADQGLDVTSQTGAANGDIHVYEGVVIPPTGAAVTGTWEPDGRPVDPANVMDTSARSTSLADFTGTDASGEWTLYLADLESGGTNMLSQWSLDISGGPPSTNLPPVLSAIPNVVMTPDGTLAIKVSASDPNGDDLSFSLDPGAPPGAWITNVVRLHPVPTTNTVLRWTPTRAFASTTNVITVRITDNGVPPKSATQTFIVRVLDYLDLALTSTNVQCDQSVAVPIMLASDGGVVNLTFSIPWPSRYFTNAMLSTTAPGIGSATLQDQTTNLVITVQALPGQSLQGAQQIGELSFLAISNRPSAFVPLQLQNVAAVKTNESLYENYVLHDARVAVVVDQALLSADVITNSARELTLYGRLNANYELQYSTNLRAPILWYPVLDYTQTNGMMRLGLDSTNPTIYYRLLQP